MARRHLGLVLTLAVLAAASQAHAATDYGLDTLSGTAGANDIPFKILGVQTLDVKADGLYFFTGGVMAASAKPIANSYLGFYDPSGALLVEIGASGSTGPYAGGTPAGTLFAASYLQTSDARLKTNIKTAGGLDVVERLRGVSFDWKNGTGHSNGVLAQDVQKVLPSAVRTAADGTMTVEYSQLIGPMIEAIKELKAENDDLRRKIEAQ